MSNKQKPQPFISFLCHYGDMTFTWDPNNPLEVAQMERYVEEKLAEGFNFFRLEGDDYRPQINSDLKGTSKLMASTGDAATDDLIVNGPATPTTNTPNELVVGERVTDPKEIVTQPTMATRPIVGG